MKVAVHVSNVRSPAIFTVLPRNGTSITPRLDAGRAADLQRIFTSSPSVLVPAGNPAALGNAISTRNRLGLTPCLNLKKIFYVTLDSHCLFTS